MGNLYEVIIIGAGQAGLAISYQLKQKDIENHLIVDAENRIGDSWRDRYKSLVLFTPKSYSALPGLKMNGEPNSYPTKNEMADYLVDYVAHFDLPYRPIRWLLELKKRVAISIYIQKMRRFNRGK